MLVGYGAAGVFGGSSNVKTLSGERWRCCHTLKGHTGGKLTLKKIVLKNRLMVQNLKIALMRMFIILKLYV